MTSPAEFRRTRLLRAGALVFVIAALGYFAYALWRTAGRNAGSERNEIVLVCSRCQDEIALSAADFGKLSLDPNTSAYPCPRCGARAARIATTRCQVCQRAIPPQPMDAPRVCPYCAAPR